MEETFWKINGTKVRMIRWDSVKEKYLVEFNNGMRQFVPIDMLIATDSLVTKDTAWGKDADDYMHYERE
jgi:hypothetical protein